MIGGKSIVLGNLFHSSAFLSCHHNQSFAQFCFSSTHIGVYVMWKTDVSFSMVCVSVSILLFQKLTSNNQARVGEQILGLHKGTGMARVEEIKNSISIDPHRPVSCERT